MTYFSLQKNGNLHHGKEIRAFQEKVTITCLKEVPFTWTGLILQEYCPYVSANAAGPCWGCPFNGNLSNRFKQQSIENRPRLLRLKHCFDFATHVGVTRHMCWPSLETPDRFISGVTRIYHWMWLDETPGPAPNLVLMAFYQLELNNVKHCDATMFASLWWKIYSSCLEHILGWNLQQKYWFCSAPIQNEQFDAMTELRIFKQSTSLAHIFWSTQIFYIPANIEAKKG